MRTDNDHALQVACVAHEVKNSLTVLKGMATYAAAGRLGELEPSDAANLARLLAGVDQVLAVMQELMDVRTTPATLTTTRPEST